MDIKIENQKVASVAIGKETFYLKEVNVSDIPELQKHVTYFEKHLQSEEQGRPWTDEEVKEFLADSTDPQKKLFEVLSKDTEGFDADQLKKQMGLTNSQALAGMRAGLTRRAKRDYGKKEDIIENEWVIDKGMNEYWLNEDYFDIVKDYFKSKE